MHVQVPTPGWLDVAMTLPDNSLLKSVHNGGTLREAKQKWISLGRDPKFLVTLYRHAGLEPAPPGYTWNQAVAWWKVNFAKFIDGTWLSQYAQYVDLIEDCNEYTAVSTWGDDPDHGESKLLSMEAAAWVWNNFYRGKNVTSADGGHGFIPQSCKFTLMCGPVANWFPVEIYDLSLKYDSPINYHPYAQCLNGERVANDFHDASGLWNNLESHYQKYPEYVFGETTVYKSSAEGWRAQGCLNGDINKLVSVLRAVQRDTQPTKAYQENRILGKKSFGAWFTVGGGTQWGLYELEKPQLEVITKMYNEESTGDDEMIDREKIRRLAQEIIDEVTINWWETQSVPFTAVAVANPLTTYNLDRTFHDSRPNVTYDLHVTEVTPDNYLKVAPALLVKAVDVKPK